MSVHKAKHWVIAAFVVVALAVVVVMVLQMRRLATPGGVAPGGGDTVRVNSVKELAAAIKDPERREAALEALRESGDVSVVDMLASLSHKSRDPEVRAACLTALGDLGDISALHVLTIGCRDEDPDVRIAGIRAIAKLDSGTAHASVATALGDGDARVQKAAAEALADIEGATEAVPAMVEVLQEDTAVAIRVAMARALANVTNAPAREALVEALSAGEQPEPAVRLQALRSLDAVDDGYRVQGAAVAVGDAADDVRAEAKRIFGGLGTNALSAITGALASPHLRGVIGRNGGAHADILDVVAAMKSPAAAEPLYQLLDMAVARSTGVNPRAEIRDKAGAALAALGEPAVAVIAEKALNAGVRWPLKVAVSKVLGGVGPSAVPTLETYAASRISLSSTEEAQLWIDTLETIGGPTAAKAIEVVRQHDPAVAFAKLAPKQSLPGAERPPPPQLEEYRLILYRGIWGGNPPSAYAKRAANLPFVGGRKTGQEPEVEAYRPTNPKNAVFHLTRTQQGWPRAYAHTLSHNNAVSFAKVERAEVGPDSLAFELRAAIQRDGYLVGGYGEYSVALRKAGDNQYRGTFDGVFRGHPIKGVAVCTKCPKRPGLRPGFEPVKPNEHPRMLFRRSDIPALRAKLNTPFGREAFRRLMATPPGGLATSRHVALGLLYRLTGDERYAMEAIDITKREMANKDFGPGVGHVWGPRFTHIALAYDLCWDAWPAAFRAEAFNYCRTASATGTLKMYALSPAANDHPCSNYFSPFCGGGALLALTYWMKPGSAPAQPAGSRLIVPEKLRGVPGKGVPVVHLRPRTPPAEWIWSGLFAGATRAGALLEALGDVSDDPIEAGRMMELDGAKGRFGPVEPRYLKSRTVYPWAALRDEQPDAAGAGMLLYTVVQNHKPGYYRVRLPGQGESIFEINGTRVLNKSYVRLEEGLYPFLLAYTGTKDMYAGVDVSFRFITDSRKEIDVLLAEEARRVKREQVLYEMDLADHERTGMAGDLIHVFRSSIFKMFLSHRFAMGTGGFQAEGAGYTSFASVTPVQYAAACYNAFGQTVTPYMDVDHFPTRYVATGIMGKRQDRHGLGRGLSCQSFNGGAEGGGAALNFITIGFPFIAEEYKPGVLWVWNEMKGVDPDKPESYVNLFSGHGSLIYTFLNYPLDGKTGKTTIEPVHPRECFPNHWQATTKGAYMWRNRWEDSDDIVFMAYANELVTRGNMGPDAAALRLAGLGYKWTTDGAGKKTGASANFFPFIVNNGQVLGQGRAPCRVLSWAANADGSGHLSMDTRLLYFVGRKGARSGHGRDGIWYPEQDPATTNYTSIRAVAVDYSGKCGAPALIGLVDKIEGPGERKWIWQEPDVRNRSGGYRMVPKENGFTMHQGPGARDNRKPASMNLTFIGGSERRVLTNGALTVGMDRSHKKAVMKKLGIKRESELPDTYEEPFELMVPAPDGESFFAVITLQHGDPPTVKRISGKGLDTVVQVGKQRVRFDGTCVRIEDAP